MQLHENRSIHLLTWKSKMAEVDIQFSASKDQRVLYLNLSVIIEIHCKSGLRIQV